MSKTVNLPEEATIEDVEDIYFQGWKLGLKALAIYRNNSKVGQPLQSKKDSEKAADGDVQRQAAVCFGLIGDRSVIDHLVRLLRGGDEAFKSIAIIALKRMTSEEFDSLEEWEAWWNDRRGRMEYL